jgi:hypothetical protein
MISARIKSAGTVTMETIAETMVRQGCTIGKGEIIAVLSYFMNVVRYYLQMGFIVDTPFVRYLPGIKGTFASYIDHFDHSKHTLRVNVQTGYQLVDALKEVSVEKIESSVQDPNLLEYTDHNSGKANTITPGGVGTIKGYRLDFNLEDQEQGIYLVNGKASYKVKTVARNSRKELIFSIPDRLKRGTYRIELRKKNTMLSPLKIHSLKNFSV